MIRTLEQKDKENWAKLYNKIANNTGFELYELEGN